MPTQIKIVWESVPIPLQITKENDPRTLGILTYAFSLLYSSREAENFDSLVSSVASWCSQSEEEISQLLIEKLGLRAKSLYGQISVRSNSITSKSKPQKLEKGISPEFLQKLQAEFPLVKVKEEYAKALRWYGERNRKLYPSNLETWISNASNPVHQTAKAVASQTSNGDVCRKCNGARRITSDESGIPIKVDCPDCFGL